MRLPARWQTSGGQIVRALRGLTTPVALSTLVGLITLFGLTGSSGFQARTTTGLVMCLVVVGQYIFIGNSGVVSFGHISFMAFGGYAAAITMIPPTIKSVLLPALPQMIRDFELPLLLGAILGGVVAALIAALIGYPIVRLSGTAAAIAFFAVLLMTYSLIGAAEPVTRGTATLSGIPLTTTPLNAFAWVVVSIFCAHIYQRTTSGLRLRCSREDEFAAKAIGVSIPRERYVALVVSAFFCGVAGALYGSLLGSLIRDSLYLKMTFMAIVMLVVGGMRSLTGAVVGTWVVVLLSELLRRIEAGFSIGPLSIPARPGLMLLGVSLLGLIILILKPNGITGGRELTAETLTSFVRRVKRNVRRKSVSEPTRPKQDAGARGTNGS